MRTSETVNINGVRKAKQKLCGACRAKRAEEEKKVAQALSLSLHGFPASGKKKGKKGKIGCKTIFLDWSAYFMFRDFCLSGRGVDTGSVELRNGVCPVVIVSSTNGVRFTLHDFCGRDEIMLTGVTG